MKYTTRPIVVSSSQMDALREAGFTDKQIALIVRTLNRYRP
jgi:alkylhydroperoxidase family enzyme